MESPCAYYVQSCSVGAGSSGKAAGSANLLGSWDNFVGTSPGPTGPSAGLKPSPTIPRNASTPNLESKARDPFADIGEYCRMYKYFHNWYVYLLTTLDQ
ncbi:hypothetical protein PR048_029708 [Dryococelus australis]|uniref:Uncharacterized protein n=1 Tax=Dryococelus australis TaxID=614101 RepID=A0ABQ9GE60_9NEOP|nr:hypothetical protein PR048_029708 [Dryococelus australis]